MTRDITMTCVAIDDGGCNACIARPPRLLLLKFRGVVVRLCPECAKLLPSGLLGAIKLLDPDGTPSQAQAYSPVVVGVALSLYAFNVAPRQRAQKLYDHFDGACMDLADLERLMEGPWVGYAMTELPMPTATVYVQHALERYGAEALHRVTFG